MVGAAVNDIARLREARPDDDQLLYPLPEQPDEVNLGRYLSGR
jgi:hypothetical protein